jgi:hypothetical protein
MESRAESCSSAWFQRRPVDFVQKKTGGIDPDSKRRK